jgi:hypothetical protein
MLMMVVSGRPAKNFFTYSARSMVESGAVLQHEKITYNYSIASGCI